MQHLDDLLKILRDNNASDLHLKVDTRPLMRVNGVLQYIDTCGAINSDLMEQFFREITSEKQREFFDRDKELDFSYADGPIGRFRFSAYIQRGTLCLTCRLIQTNIPTIDDLLLPNVCKELALKNSGLILICGPTGCGKSTTLAAMIGYMNEKTKKMVITIEDPIEYLHQDKLCSFSQREVGMDTQSFSSAIRHALRQDPDVLLIGEMRDLDSISNTLTAAETGHLVLTTLHTPNVVNAIDRIIDVFPPHQQEQVRVQLADILAGVIYQKLIPTTDGAGRVVACEVMLNNQAVSNLIRSKKNYQLLTVIQSASEKGMQTLDDAIFKLHKEGRISREEALASCVDRLQLKDRMTQRGSSASANNHAWTNNAN
ncbi:MAG: PilT/PilU family type 4a pilus ATPase [Dehalococcoidales bacterium]|jgi:twitching motility protein PilT